MTRPCCIPSTLSCSSCCLRLLKVASLLFPQSGLRLGRTMKYSLPECSQGWFLLVISALRPQFPCPPFHPSDVAFTSSLLISQLYLTRQSFITKSLWFVSYFLCLSPFPDENRELDYSFHQCIWHIAGAQ